MTVDGWIRVWRVVVLLIGGVTIMYASFIILWMMFGRMNVSSYRRKAHVLCIATSYILLALGIWLTIAGRSLRGDSVTWYLPMASVAYPLGIYALIMLTNGGRTVVGLRQAQRASVRTEKATGRAHVAAEEALDDLNTAIEDIAEERKG